MLHHFRHNCPARIKISIANSDFICRQSHDLVQKQTWQQQAVKLFAWQIQQGFKDVRHLIHRQICCGNDLLL